MSALRLLKFLAACLMVHGAQAQAQSALIDEEGFWTDPTCDTPAQLTERMKSSGKTPTGIKASTKDWDIEIYENSVNGAWTALGISKEAKYASACPLQSGSSSKRYKDQLFYKRHFSR